MIASRAHFSEFFLLMFRRHLQQPIDKSRLVFDPLRIVLDGLAEKTLDVRLKLLPSLIRCLLIHIDFLLFQFSMMINRFILVGLPAAIPFSMSGNGFYIRHRRGSENNVK
jgi:hypothetical protein